MMKMLFLLCFISVVFSFGKSKPKPEQHPLDVISVLDGKIKINDENLKTLVANLKEKLPNHVAVISVVGISRSGKSFLMNLMAKYLKHLESNSDKEWFSGEVNTYSKEFFRYGPANKATTSGVWYSRPFIIDGNAILLMDTQGLFETSSKIDPEIYALSSLLSSHQILNVRSKIDKLTLEAIHNLDNVVKEINSKSKKPVKTPQLEILVRDVSYFWEHCNLYDPDNYNYQSWKNKMNDVGAQTFDISGGRKTEKNKMHDDIKEMHPNIKYFGLVNPGNSVSSKEKVSLNTDDVDKDFKVLTKDFIEKYVGNIKTDVQELQENEKIPPHIFERRVREFTNACNGFEGLAEKFVKPHAKEVRARFWENTREIVQTFLVLLFVVLGYYNWRCQINDICLPYSNQLFAAQGSVFVYFTLRIIYLFVISGFYVIYNMYRFIFTTLRFIYQTVSWPFHHPFKSSFLAILGSLAYYFLQFRIM